jgi:pyruvate,water dikinase
VKPLPLEEAADLSLHGGKAVSLGAALRAGLPVPSGIVLPWPLAEEVAKGDGSAVALLGAALRGHLAPWAVRSSAAEEDSNKASFAGQFQSCLNVREEAELPPSVKRVLSSATSPHVSEYRQRLGLSGPVSVAVVIQRLFPAEVSGVLFTVDPVTFVKERVIEGSLGLGEAVVGGLVIPDRFRLSEDGRVLERSLGEKHLAVVAAKEGGTEQVAVPKELQTKLCLTEAQLALLSNLAIRCEALFGGALDIEWALAKDTLALLQCRPVTRRA